MKNSDKPAYPTQTHTYPDDIDGGKSIDGHWGLSKRERFAMAAMQGILAGDVEQQFDSTQVDVAVEFADALLEELEKQND